MILVFPRGHDPGSETFVSSSSVSRLSFVGEWLENSNTNI